jgi:hypothetical protein
MLLKENTRQIFVDLGCAEKASNKLKSDSRDDEFLLSRIILLTTYGTNIKLEKLIDQNHLAENICTNLGRHSKKYGTEKKSKVVDPMEDMALSESLKLLFNVAHFCPQRSGAFSPALSHILAILDNTTVSSTKPLEAPMGSLLNSILNLPLKEAENNDTLFPKENPGKYVAQFVNVLDKSTKVYADDELNTLVSPITVLLQRMYEAANPDVQKHMRELLLPTFDDRKLPLGRGESLSARLLRISASITTPKVQESAGSLLFELSGNDAKKFVENIGYGYASGFLVRHKIPLPEDALETQEVGNGESSSLGANQSAWKAVNPITGQTLESEPEVSLPQMTDEEKEREAERLFVLFERYGTLYCTIVGSFVEDILTLSVRLKKTGVMDVTNPVAAAVREGRFEELDDDADSD